MKAYSYHSEQLMTPHSFMKEPLLFLPHYEELPVVAPVEIPTLEKSLPTLQQNLSNAELLKENIALDSEDAFFIGDLGEVVRQYQRWKRLLPRIEPFYAVKCNTEPNVLRTLAQLGIGFDCASRNEISQILEMGVDSSKIIYANPCKQASHIQYAQKQNVQMMTFDNADELYKIKKYFPEAKVVLRIITDDSKSACPLSTKFGASLDVTRDLIQLALDLELDLIGVSFHVGSGCFDASSFKDAVHRARFVFDQAAELGLDLTLLDIGGGFPGNFKQEGCATFEEIVQVLRPAVDELFPAHVRVIAEPGRFFVSSAFTLHVNITAKRVVQSVNEQKKFMYYVNDGVYGSFNCILFDHAVVFPKVLSASDDNGEPSEEFDCSVWGPTCDSMDCITKQCRLPELQVGHWLYFENMGAYTVCAASTFNGFKKSNIFYTNSITED